jgi:hypothetical protein
MSSLDDLISELKVRPAAKRKAEAAAAAAAASAPAVAARQAAGITAPPPSSLDGTDTPHAIKLIDVIKSKLQVQPEGAALLGGMDPKTAVNLMFIFGNARSGKSFMVTC